MKLTMLGTGNALVTECYNTCFVLSDGNDHFMVDGGGGMTVLHQLKYAGLDWRQMRTIFVTHKHIDHLLGIIWMMRMICQHMREGTYEGEATIYAHDEVIVLLRDLAGKLLQKKELPFLDSRLHLIAVADGEEKTILGRKTTFFDIGSTKAKQYGFCMELGSGEKLTCCGDEPYNECEKQYAEHSTWLLLFLCAFPLINPQFPWSVLNAILLDISRFLNRDPGILYFPISFRRFFFYQTVPCPHREILYPAHTFYCQPRCRISIDLRQLLIIKLVLKLTGFPVFWQSLMHFYADDLSFISPKL